jgi:DNA-binding MarR family transcriptional regulator
MKGSSGSPTGRRQLVQEVIAEMRALASEMDGLDQAAADRHGLNRTDMRCVEILRRLGPMQPKDLAEAIGYTTGGITTVIDRLEVAGYAVRHPDRYDRRKVFVEATSLAGRQGASIYGTLIKAFEQELAETPDGDLTVIRDFLRRSQSLMKEHVAGVRAATARSAAR